MTRALLVGKEPGTELGYAYVTEPPYDAVVIGSLTLSQLLRFQEERVLQALAEGKPVYLYTPGLPTVKNRALAGSLTAAQRELKNWGVLFTDGGRKKLITAEEARRHPNRNVITRALGPDAEAVCDGYITNLKPGEFILLCTDGLVDTVMDQEILFEVIHGDSLDTCLQRLLSIAKAHGAPDNVTCVLIQI